MTDKKKLRHLLWQRSIAKGGVQCEIVIKISNTVLLDFAGARHQVGDCSSYFSPMTNAPVKYWKNRNK